MLYLHIVHAPLTARRESREAAPGPTDDMQSPLPCQGCLHDYTLDHCQEADLLWTRKHGLTGKDLRTLRLLVKFVLKVQHLIVDAPYNILYLYYDKTRDIRSNMRELKKAKGYI